MASLTLQYENQRDVCDNHEKNKLKSSESDDKNQKRFSKHKKNDKPRERTNSNFLKGNLLDGQIFTAKPTRPNKNSFKTR